MDMQKEIRLCDLPVGRSALVERVECADYLLRRVYDMGIVKGAVIQPLFRAPFGDPVAYVVKNTMIALRSRDSRDIYVRCQNE